MTQPLYIGPDGSLADKPGWPVTEMTRRAWRNAGFELAEAPYFGQTAPPGEEERFNANRGGQMRYLVGIEGYPTHEHPTIVVVTDWGDFGPDLMAKIDGRDAPVEWAKGPDGFEVGLTHFNALPLRIRHLIGVIVVNLWDQYSVWQKTDFVGNHWVEVE